MIREFTQIGDAVAAAMEHNARLADGYWHRRAEAEHGDRADSVTDSPHTNDSREEQP